MISAAVRAARHSLAAKRALTPGTEGARVVRRKDNRAGVTQERVDARWIVVRWDEPLQAVLGDPRETSCVTIGSMKVETRRDVAVRAIHAILDAELGCEIGMLERVYATTGRPPSNQQQARLGVLYAERSRRSGASRRGLVE